MIHHLALTRCDLWCLRDLIELLLRENRLKVFTHGWLNGTHICLLLLIVRGGHGLLSTEAIQNIYIFEIVIVLILRGGFLRGIGTRLLHGTMIVLSRLRILTPSRFVL